jgi:hypothetical protein
VQPLFDGKPQNLVKISPPERKLGDGFSESEAPPPLDRSFSSFRKRAEAAMRRENYSRSEQRLVSSYFESVKKQFERD